MSVLQLFCLFVAIVATAVELSPSIPTDRVTVKVALLVLILASLFAADKVGVK